MTRTAAPRGMAPLLALTAALLSCRDEGAPEVPSPAPAATPSDPKAGTGPGGSPALPELPMPAPPAAATPAADDFRDLGSATRDELLARAGRPDVRFGSPDDETWLYRRVARGKSGAEGYPEVRLQRGRVVQITFHPDEESLLARVP